MKTCSKCGQSKPATTEYFYKHIRNKKDGLCTYCIECDKIAKKEYYLKTKAKTLDRVREWQSENADAVRGYKRAWKQKNPGRVVEYKYRRRGLEAGCDWTAKDWQRILDKYDHACLACGSKENIVVDHVVPLSRGGTNTLDNLQPLCAPCNGAKWTKTIDYRNP